MLVYDEEIIREKSERKSSEEVNEQEQHTQWRERFLKEIEKVGLHTEEVRCVLLNSVSLHQCFKKFQVFCRCALIKFQMKCAGANGNEKQNYSLHQTACAVGCVMYLRRRLAYKGSIAGKTFTIIVDLKRITI